ncbi:hypothetical protein MHYP_G00348150 [Metynnis hypsauchen]
MRGPTQGNRTYCHKSVDPFQARVVSAQLLLVYQGSTEVVVSKPSDCTHDWSCSTAEATDIWGRAEKFTISTTFYSGSQSDKLKHVNKGFKTAAFPAERRTMGRVRQPLQLRLHSLHPRGDKMFSVLLENRRICVTLPRLENRKRPGLECVSAEQ